MPPVAPRRREKAAFRLKFEVTFGSEDEDLILHSEPQLPYISSRDANPASPYANRRFETLLPVAPAIASVPQIEPRQPPQPEPQDRRPAPQLRSARTPWIENLRETLYAVPLLAIACWTVHLSLSLSFPTAIRAGDRSSPQESSFSFPLPGESDVENVADREAKADLWKPPFEGQYIPGFDGRSYRITSNIYPCQNPDRSDCRTIPEVYGGVPHAHQGVDVATPVGTPIFAGNIYISCHRTDGGGLWIVGDRPDGMVFQIAHAQACLPGTYGEVSVIGSTGNSGRYTTGPHGHIEIGRRSSTPVGALLAPDEKSGVPAVLVAELLTGRKAEDLYSEVWP